MKKYWVLTQNDEDFHHMYTLDWETNLFIVAIIVAIIGLCKGYDRVEIRTRKWHWVLRDE